MNRHLKTATYKRNILLQWLLLAVGYALSGPLKLLSGLSGRKRSLKKAKVLITKEDRVLLVKNTLDPARWTLPGGAMRKMETPQDAVIRELHEELGLHLKLAGVRHYATLRRQDSNLLYDYEIFTIELIDNVTLKLSLEILSAQWFKLKNMPKKTNFIQQIQFD